MANGRIPKDVLYGALDTGTCTVDLRYKGTWKRDMKMAEIDVINYETFAKDVVKTGVKTNG